jgi:hypothetical protein
MSGAEAEVPGAVPEELTGKAEELKEKVIIRDPEEQPGKTSGEKGVVEEEVEDKYGAGNLAKVEFLEQELVEMSKVKGWPPKTEQTADGYRFTYPDFMGGTKTDEVAWYPTKGFFVITKTWNRRNGRKEGGATCVPYEVMDLDVKIKNMRVDPWDCCAILLRLVCFICWITQFMVCKIVKGCCICIRKCSKIRCFCPVTVGLFTGLFNPYMLQFILSALGTWMMWTGFPHDGNVYTMNKFANSKNLLASIILCLVMVVYFPFLFWWLGLFPCVKQRCCRLKTVEVRNMGFNKGCLMCHRSCIVFTAFLTLISIIICAAVVSADKHCISCDEYAEFWVPRMHKYGPIEAIDKTAGANCYANWKQKNPNSTSRRLFAEEGGEQAPKRQLAVKTKLVTKAGPFKPTPSKTMRCYKKKIGKDGTADMFPICGVKGCLCSSLDELSCASPDVPPTPPPPTPPVNATPGASTTSTTTTTTKPIVEEVCVKRPICVPESSYSKDYEFATGMQGAMVTQGILMTTVTIILLVLWCIYYCKKARDNWKKTPVEKPEDQMKDDLVDAYAPTSKVDIDRNCQYYEYDIRIWKRPPTYGNALPGKWLPFSIIRTFDRFHYGSETSRVTLKLGQKADPEEVSRMFRWPCGESKAGGRGD